VSRQRVNSEGTRLRLNQLQTTTGWSARRIGKIAGIDGGTVRSIPTQSSVNLRTARLVYDLCLIASPVAVPWDDDGVDSLAPGSSGLGRPRKAAAVVAEDLDDLAAHYGGRRERSILGWDVRTRRHVAARLGMRLEALDRAVYRDRALQRNLVGREAA
jgi:hypothetical protein